MNPVLLKPEADTRSQVVVDGVVRRDLTEMPWRDRGPHLWPAMADGVRQPACRARARRHRGRRQPGGDQPARPRQQPDARPRRRRQRCSSATSTAAGRSPTSTAPGRSCPTTTRERLAGFVLNKFRGDPALLESGPTRLTELTGMAAAGMLPMLDHGLPDEEGATVRAVRRGDALDRRRRPLPVRVQPRRAPRPRPRRPRPLRHRPGRPARLRRRRAPRFQARRRRHRLVARRGLDAALRAAAAARPADPRRVRRGDAARPADRRPRRRRGRVRGARAAAVRHGHAPDEADPPDHDRVRATSRRRGRCSTG